MFSIIFSSRSTRRGTKLSASVKAAAYAAALAISLTCVAGAQAAKKPFAPAGVLNSIEFVTNSTAGTASWEKVLKRMSKDRAGYATCRSGGSNCSGTVKSWLTRIESWRNLDDNSKLAAVNNWANTAISYVSDARQYGRADYWASPVESLTSGRGDCEDYVLLKYASLKALGFSENRLRIVVVNDLKRGLGHAVLSVKLASGTFILDNQNRRIFRDDSLPRYAPVYSLNGSGRWINIATRNLRKVDNPVMLVANATPVDVTPAAPAANPTPFAETPDLIKPVKEADALRGLWSLSVDSSDKLASTLQTAAAILSPIFLVSWRAS